MRADIKAYMEQNKEAFFKRIQELVRIESIVGNEMASQRFMEERFKEIGLTIYEVVPEYEKLKKHEAFVDSEIPFEGRKNIVGIHEGTGNGRSLTLHGHADVVSPGALSNWTVDPWGAEIKDGKLYGRGAADMKSGLLANWFALKAVKALGYDIKGDVQLHSVIRRRSGRRWWSACLYGSGLSDGRLYFHRTA